MTRQPPHKIGLTGSIGMGKSTVAGFFLKEGVAVWDADAAVHKLYQKNGAGVAAIASIAPTAIVKDAVDRAKLSAEIKSDPSLLKKIEDIIHPLVAQDRTLFIETTDAQFALCDIPLLFENGMEADFDTIVVVTASADTQRKRVLARDGMTPDKFEFILSRQMPDEEKRKRADFIVETDGTFDDTRDQVLKILTDLRQNDP